jgi:carboxymethylenebutenolidase
MGKDRPVTTTTTQLALATPDGPCTTEVVAPTGHGPWPAVIVFFDAGGLRPAMTRIAQRIAEAGYLVAQPDLFHRAPPLAQFLGGPPTAAAVRAVFRDEARRGKFTAEYYQPAIDYGNLQKTIGALLDHLSGRPDCSGRVATTGYCLGGNASVRVATIFGDRIAATAGFHPGRLVTDQPDSPHLRAQTIKSRVYLGPATGDLPPEAEAKLRAQLDAGHVRYTIEHYDARHGYVIDDSDAYDPAAANRQYAALTKLLDQTVRR